KAINYSHKDPGTTWLLFIEFTKINNSEFANKALLQLHKLLLEYGAQTSSIISQQLIHFAIESKSNKAESQQYMNWAKIFDPYSSRPQQEEFWANFPGSVFTNFKYFFSSAFKLSNNWEPHLKTVYSLYMWFRNAAALFIFLVFLIYTMRFLPYAAHSLADRFPDNVSLTLRTILACGIILSFVSFGIIPFLWFSAFFLWRFINNTKEKLLFLCALFLLLFAPLDTSIQGFYKKTTDPESTAMLFSKAVSEGYSEQEHRKIYTFCKNNPSDYLANLSNAMYSLKNNNLVSSLNYGEQALALHPHDPVVQINVGNIFFLNENFDKAKNLYKLASDKGYITAQFNLAQCLFHENQTAAATEHIEKAALKDPDRINTFLKNNDTYFTDMWPALRKVMFTDYQAKSLWTSIIPSEIFNNKEATVLWGNAFLGLPPKGSFIFTAVMFAILLAITIRSSSRKNLRTVFECRFCGRVICRKCKTGLLCQSCSDAIKMVHNEKSLHSIQMSIWNNFHRFRIIREWVFDILFPGTGLLLGERKPFWVSIAWVSATSLIYSLYFSILKGILLRESFSVKTVLFIIIFLVYNLVFVVKQRVLYTKRPGLKQV
ncbi:MAG: hypothetical protein Q4F84_03550, partial [Fibrobacter sp.]|nr:hypothetical protein [Fibrobacter sp.]